MQVPAGLEELLRQAQLLLQHVIECEHRRAVSCQGCPSTESLSNPRARASPTSAFFPPGAAALGPTPSLCLDTFQK